MPITEKPVTYESRGREFGTKEEAERHDAVHAAREELEQAQRKFQRVLAQSAITADGYQFEFGVFRDYWQVKKPWHSMPYLVKTCYLCWSWSVRESGEVVEIREDSEDKPARYVPIKELYADENNALAALLIAKREFISVCQREVKEFAARISK